MFILNKGGKHTNKWKTVQFIFGACDMHAWNGCCLESSQDMAPITCKGNM